LPLTGATLPGTVGLPPSQSSPVQVELVDVVVPSPAPPEPPPEPVDVVVLVVEPGPEPPEGALVGLVDCDRVTVELGSVTVLDVCEWLAVEPPLVVVFVVKPEPEPEPHAETPRPSVSAPNRAATIDLLRPRAI
jgi:hypothetical protein